MREIVREALFKRRLSCNGLAARLKLPVSGCNRWLYCEIPPKSAKRRRMIAEFLELPESEIWPEDY